MNHTRKSHGSSLRSKLALFLFSMLTSCTLWGQVGPSAPQVKLETSQGTIILSLFDDTPLHRDNFIHQVKAGAFNGKEFNRVIADFVIQCGEEGQADVIPAEIHYPTHYHHRGALAMGRCSDDPELKSAQQQFYIVWGKQYDDDQLNRAAALIHERSGGLHQLDTSLRSYYKSHPGLPALDGSYTVFGQVVEGLDIVEKIQSLPTDKQERTTPIVTIIQASMIAPKTEQPANSSPIWTVQGHCTLVGNVSGQPGTLEAYADGRFILREWYGVERHDLEFSLRTDGGIEILNYDKEKKGECQIMTHRSDIKFVTIPQDEERPYGGMEGDEQSGRLHFPATAHKDSKEAIKDRKHKEYIFEW